MSKSKQTRPKGDNTDTPLDTSDKNQDFEIDVEYYKNEQEELKRLKHESLEKPLNIKVESEDIVEIKPPFSSLFFKKHFTTDQMEDYELDDINELVDRFIHQSDEFIKLVKKRPSLVLNDFIVKFVIKRLQVDRMIGSSIKARKAKDILKKAGLEVFIRKKAPQKRSEEEFFEDLKNNPQKLVSLVYALRERLKEFYHPPYKEDPDIKTKDLQRAFNKIFNKSMPTKLEKIVDELYGNNIALAFIAFAHDFSFPSLIRFWKSKAFGDKRKRILAEFKLKL